MNPLNSLEVIVAAFSVLSFLGGGIAWYRSRIEQGVSSRRDFEHLKRNYGQMTESLKLIVDTLEEIKAVTDRMEPLRDQITEIRIWIMRQNDRSNTQ